MPDVVFVMPNFNGYVSEEPVGTLLLSTILHNAGIRTKILPFYHFGDIKDFHQFIDTAVDQILSHNPTIVSFYTRCDTYHISITMAQHIKRKQENVYIVFAGPQADISSLDTMQVIPEIDYICCGEGETTVVPFFSSLLAKKPDHTIAGLVFREGNEIIQNPRPALIENLDTLPTIDYSLLEVQTTKHQPYVLGLFPVDVGRGCPFSCTFCSTKSFWGRKYRLKSNDRIIAEIKHIHDLFGVTSFNFVHDMFTMNKKRVLQICDELVNIGFPITWRCSARLDCLDNELIDAMAASGMTSIFIGIESGSPQMQRKINKNLKLDNIIEKLTYMSAKGIEITTSFIFGFPDETESELEQTIALMVQLCKLPSVHIQHYLCAFFAGTEITRQYMHDLQMASVFSDTTGEIAVNECRELIAANPKLFPHYFEYRSELRDRAKYYKQFFDCWVAARPVYEYIALKHYDNHYCSMLDDFTSSNYAILCEGKSTTEILRQGSFLDRFSDDPYYTQLKEATRFFVWKRDPHTASREIFECDVKALLDGSDIPSLKSSLTMATYTRDSSGSQAIKLHVLR